MLRLLHTSDWHLGHTLHGRDRRFEHQRFLAWLLDALVDARADALLIAGDVFETANPPASAISDLSEFLAEARRRVPDLDVVVIAGNHDSALRLDALAPLMRFANIHVVGGLPRRDDGSIDHDRLLIPLHDASGEIGAWLAAVPFLRVSDLHRGQAEAEPEAEPEAEADSEDAPAWRADPLIRGVEAIYASALAAAQAKASDGQAVIATGHLYMRGTAISELSERKILGGNQHALPTAIFTDWAYVGLGHLHLAQAVEQSELVRYCGSPIPLSLTEADYQHQVLLASFDGPQLRVCQTIEIPRAVEVLRIPAEGPKVLDEVLFELEHMNLDASCERERWPWLEVRVRLDAPHPDLRTRIDRVLRQRPVRLLKITVEHVGVGGSLADFPAHRDLERIDPQQVFVDCHERAYGSPPDDELLAAFHELREAVERGDPASAELVGELAEPGTSGAEAEVEAEAEPEPSRPSDREAAAGLGELSP
ncbi:Nuclease SbcCD subunit D [Enhygromyxa salina]|uniref:Nuclease SbcCD subunit D n=1 Tax=Enhygromyxa salina TaxID=215803 RepID=A0A2S9Y130_9BACT|nr:exonuclease SbcCD subunit D C-terminal domain-containing protein [Enhygromyxa salina]PRP98796.1 Nuclease SbcCD subunit D [Enhygromyxa salina]